MFLAGQPARWAASKPHLQGLGAVTTDDGVSVDVLYVNGSSRSRKMTVRLFLYAGDKPVTLKVKNPRLAPGVYERVMLHGT